MTNATPGPVEVTQADREAASAFEASLRGRVLMTDRAMVANELAEAFARHRKSAERAFEERERKLREAGEVLRREAALLHQNAVGCARNHYGCDFELHGMPQWLVDTGARIFTATQALKETPDAQ